MHTRWPVFLGVALALSSPVAAGETETSYSLKELRAIARTAHPTLDSAAAAAEAAAGVLRQSSAYPNPEIRFGYGRGRPRGGGDSGSESSIELVQSIELPGIRNWRGRSAELGARSAELDLVLARTAIDATVTRLVFTALLEQRRAEIARESAEVASRLLALLEHRVDLGESSPLEAVKARTEWFARRRDLVDAENGLRTARAALNRFCGDRLPEGYGIAETLERPGPVALPADLPQRLQEKSPALLRAEIAVEHAKAQIEVSKKQVFPRFDLFAGHDTELDKKSTRVGVGLTIPLWNRNRGRSAAATAEQARASADTRRLAVELHRSLAEASTAYQSARAAIRLHEDGWTAASRQALDIASFSFRNGEASLLDVLDAQRSYLAVRSAEAESWAALALARADIELLLAGPLESENANETP